MKDVKIGKELLIVLIAGVVILSSGIFYFVYSRQSPPKEPGSLIVTPVDIGDGFDKLTIKKKAQASTFDTSKLPPRPSDLALAKYYDDGIKYENAILKSPQDFEAYLNAGLVWKSLGDLAHSAGSGSMVSTAEPLTNELVWYDFSADAYRRAVESFDVSATHLVVSQVEPYVFWLNLGNVEKLAKRYNEAESAYRDGVKNFPDEPQLYLALAELYRYNLKKPPSEVIKVYEELIRLYPNESLYKQEISALKEKTL